MSETFDAYVLEEQGPAALRQLSERDLPDAEVTVDVSHSRPDMLVRKPATLSAAQSMAVGTAGLTAMLCVLRLERAGVTPDQGPVIVTGAAGGVGSVAVALLAGLGYEVHAATGRPALHDYLRELGAAAFLDRVLRGVSLLGVDSVLAPTVAREQSWDRLAVDLPLRTLDAITSVHGFGELPDLAGQILAGQVRGRVVIEIGR